MATHQKLQKQTQLAVAGVARAAARDIGQIVVLEDSDGVVAQRNPFNLQQQTITFTPSTADAARYRFQVSGASYDPAAASAGTRLDGLDDDDTRPVSLPFAFPFFGATYRQVYVNSDGNLTFTAGDTALDRSLGRLTSGAPRIAGLFSDLNPPLADDGVRVLSEASRLVVSWSAVPQWQPSGIGPLQTFQIRLYPSGRIEFAYASISSEDIVVGISPGRLTGSSSYVSFTSGSSQEFTSTVAERFGDTQAIDIVVAAQKFFETHDDAYDYLVFYNNLGVAADVGAVAYEVSVRNDRAGIGDERVDIGAEFGSRRRLQAVLNLGPLSQYPADPNAVVPLRLISRDTPLSIIGHETGHLFLAYASVRDPRNPDARPMLGRQMAHWNFAFNSEASLLEGNRIRDDGEGASPRFTTTATVEGYSPLDQYLMGFRAPEEVPPTFLVTDPNISTFNRDPQAGVPFNGIRRDVTVEEIIQAEGRRTPDHTVSQRGFRFAFILVVKQATEPRAEDIAQIETYRREFETYYRRVASERATADAQIQRSLRLSTFPAAGVLQSSTITASVSIEKPATEPLTVLLETQAGAISVPKSVILPPGATRVTFPLQGLRVGVDELVARTAEGSAYETVRSRVQVLSGLAGLKLAVSSGDKQLVTPGAPLPNPVEVRVSDINNLPYAGISIRAAVTAGGSVTPAAGISDEDGIVRFRWTPGPSATNELQAAVDGGPASATVTAIAVGRPALESSQVVNAASFAPGLSPGAIATMFGTNLAGGSTARGGFPFPVRLASVQVLLNNRAVPLIYVSDRQINFVVPLDLAGDFADVSVTAPGGASPVVRVPVLPAQPGIFYNPDTGFGAILIAGTGATTEQRPAVRGEVVEVYATGLGRVQPSAIIGLSDTVLKPTASVGGASAPVLFSGLAPGFLGLYQVNVQIPDSAPSGVQTLRLEMRGALSNEVKISIR